MAVITDRKGEGLYTIEPMAAAGFEALYALYAAAFPVSEQKPKAQLHALVNDPDYAVYTVSGPEGLEGFAVFFAAETAPFFLLEYLAVAPRNRSKGIGSRLLRDSLAALFAQRRRKPVLIEIDAVDASGKDGGISRKREAFYRRNGCTKILGFDYILGLKSDRPAPPMELMLFDPGRTGIGREILRGWVETVYEKVYGRSRNVPEIARMFADLPPTLPLG